MTKQVILIALFGITFSCSMESDEPVETQKSQPEEFNFENWKVENTIEPYNDLIDFTTFIATSEESDTIDLAYTSDFTEPMIYENDDSLIVEFYKEQWIGCDIIGNIRIEADTMKLLYSNICSPYEDGFVEESAIVRFRYQINMKEEYRDLTIHPEERELIK